MDLLRSSATEGRWTGVFLDDLRTQYQKIKAEVDTVSLHFSTRE